MPFFVHRLINFALNLALIFTNLPPSYFLNFSEKNQGSATSATTQALMFPSLSAKHPITTAVDSSKGPHGFSPLLEHEKRGPKASALVDTPASKALLQKIKNEVRKNHSEADLAVIDWAYHHAERLLGSDVFAPSEEAFMDHTSRVALSVARLQASPIVIAAALLHIVGSVDVKELPLEHSGISRGDQKRISDLVNSLEHYRHEPFKPPIRLQDNPALPPIEDPMLTNLLDRQLRWLTKETRNMSSVNVKNKADFNAARASLFTLILAYDLQSLTSLNDDSDPVFKEKIHSRMALLNIPQATRLLLGTVPDFFADDYFKVFNAKENSDVKREQRKAIGAPREET